MRGTTRTIMSTTAKIINIHDHEKAIDMKATIENGYYRIANELGLAMCKTRLNGREGRIVQAIIMKTFGFNQSTDWICNAQIAELTGISIGHISETKSRLFARNILIKKGREIGINTVVSQWKNPEQGFITPKNGANKKPKNGVVKTQKRSSKNPETGKIKPNSGLHIRQDTITKDKTIKNKQKELDFSCWLSKPSEQVLDDWFAMRKRKKADVSQTVINRFANELNLAVQNGYTADDVLGECIVRNWQGFKFSWMQNDQPQAKNRCQPDNILDTSWADGLKV